MTTYYVGADGNNSNNGTTWALRRLTIASGITLLSAGDTLYVGPGVYREGGNIPSSANGSSGSQTLIVGDVTGEHTDGVGGVVRLTGSDNDQTATRANAFYFHAPEQASQYITIRGFSFDMYSGNFISGGSWSGEYYLNDLIVEDCVFFPGSSTGNYIHWQPAGGYVVNSITRRNLFVGNRNTAVNFIATARSDSNNLVENNLFVANGNGVMWQALGGITVKNNTMIGGQYGIRNNGVPPTGQKLFAYNNIITGMTNVGIFNVNTSEAWTTNNHNTLFGNVADYQNATAGANSLTYPPLFESPILLDGIKYPWWNGKLSQWSQVRRIAGTSEATEDLFGIARPATAAKNSWGAFQYNEPQRSTTQAQAGTASLKLADAGRHQMYVPVSAESTTISVYVYREANYAGTLPQMVIKQPGQSDITVTDTGSASGWNLLTYTLTPSALPPYVVVELVSNNTATTGSYGVYFDTLAVS